MPTLRETIATAITTRSGTLLETSTMNSTNVTAAATAIMVLVTGETADLSSVTAAINTAGIALVTAGSVDSGTVDDIADDIIAAVTTNTSGVDPTVTLVLPTTVGATYVELFIDNVYKGSYPGATVSIPINPAIVGSNCRVVVHTKIPALRHQDVGLSGSVNIQPIHFGTSVDLTIA